MSRFPNIDEWHALMDALEVREACLFCGWEFVGPAGDGRKHALQHRRSAHPEVKPARRRNGRHLKSFRQAPLDDDEKMELDQERFRRARLNGIELDAESV